MEKVVYDIAIIGAGINGCCSAYTFTQLNKRVILFDKYGIAKGGSGAAGAFISPKFSKSGELKEIIDKAFLYSLDFYKNNFNHCFNETRLIHIAKDKKDDTTLKFYKKHTKYKLFDIPNDFIKHLSLKAQDREMLSINSGIVNAKNICFDMAKDAEFRKEEVVKLVYIDGIWHINDKYYAKDVILTTGAYNIVIDEKYIGLRGVWGHRIELKTSTKSKYSLHQFVSISNTTNGILAIGATHNLTYNPLINDKSYNVQEGRDELLEKVSQTMEIKDIEIVKDYMGLRSSPHDYMPIAGLIVDSRRTLQECNIKDIRVKKPNFDKLIYYKNLYMLNGSGGYGFVLAPYLADLLKELIIDKKEIDKKLSTARFFTRWVKRNSSLELD